MNHSSAAQDAKLALDEMFALAIAAALRDRGHDVVAVAERDDLRAMDDDDVFAWAAGDDRWLLTENVKDFRPTGTSPRRGLAATVRLTVWGSRGSLILDLASAPMSGGASTVVGIARFVE